MKIPSIDRMYLAWQVARCGGFVSASKVLHKSQSSLSRAVALLELELEVAIFERHHSGVMLTQAGEVFVARFERAMQWWGRSLGHTDLIPSQFLNEMRLRIFLELERVGHMPTVAQLMGVSQPAVSQAVGALEQGLKSTLFRRDKYGFNATDEARYLALNIRLVLSELRSIYPEIDQLRHLTRGTVFIGALPLSRSVLLPKALVSMHKDYPEVRFLTFESPYEVLAQGLRSGDLDFIVGALRTDADVRDLHQEEILHEELILVAGKHHPYATCNNLSEIPRTMSWIFPRKNSPARLMIDEKFLSPVNLHVAIETGDAALIRSALINSDLIAVVSERQLIYELEVGELVRLPIKLHNTKRAIGITYRKSAILSPAASLLVEHIRACAQGEELPPKA